MKPTRICIVRVPITISIKDVEAETWEQGGAQCSAIFPSRSSVRFCNRREFHEGDHRADRVQWRTEEIRQADSQRARERKKAS